MNLQEIAKLLWTQDNRATAHPIFLVQQRRRTYGFDPQYSDQFVWLYEDECEEVSDEEASTLEAQFQKDYSEPEGFTRVAYVDTWEFVQPFLTDQAAEAYIEANRHNLTDPRIYVDSGHRNPEWQLIREHFRQHGLSEGANKIMAERVRQIEEENWTAEHDDELIRDQLIEAAISYAGKVLGEDLPFPWDEDFDRRGDHKPTRLLEIAGALIAAELDRRERATRPPLIDRCDR